MVTLLPGRARAAQAPRSSGQSSFDPWVEVHTANLRQNAAEVARLTKRPVLAVIKNNGYGLGVTSSAYAVALQKPEIHGPPMYYTQDFEAAGATVRTLAGLEPELVITGHGRAMEGADMRAA